MSTDPDIWLAFARSFGVLVMVLALLLLGFYLLRRFMAARGGQNFRDTIQVLTIHHLSPKEKLVLVKVLDQTILIGVTPNQISKIAVMDKPVDGSPKDTGARFSDVLTGKLNPLVSKKEVSKGDPDA